jgi:hypothetical protein
VPEAARLQPAPTSSVPYPGTTSKMAVGYDLHQLALRAEVLEEHDELQLEEDDRVHRRPAAPLDVERVRPTQDTNEVAAEQVKAFLCRSPEEGIVPLFVFDAGYDLVKVQSRGWRGLLACEILVRLRAGRRFYADPSLAGPPAHTGRPRHHGPKMKCSDSSTWPEPVSNQVCM